ncbi:MAG: response regulator, partial [Magnetococcales bacterium]|nr:response regulator [Magnetococcales bacterium]
EERLITPEGRERWIRTSKLPLTDEQEEIIGLLGTREEITARKQAEAELTRAKEEALAASRAKSAFLSAMSHEIRTPMNVVIGMSDLLLETGLSSEQRNYVGKLQVAGSNLLEVINQILDLSKIEAGQMELVEKPISPRELLRKVVELLEVLAASKGLCVNLQVDEALPQWLLADEARLNQVLYNLLGNAIKFTERGEIRLQAGIDAEAPDRLHLQVVDTGIGIESDYLQRIFTPFTQADPSITRRFGGTGLGLSISWRLVSLMGGTLQVESQPGQGSTFHVHLPLKIPATPPLEAKTTTPRAQGKASSLHILLVEDALENQELIHAFLKHTPHRLTLANHGEEALQRIGEGRFDLVFMDVQMPVMDGYTATRAIREKERHNGGGRLPIVALTAHALEEESARSLEAGCDLFLSKPIKKRRLLEVIEQFGRQAVMD